MAIAYGSAGSPNAGTTTVNITLPATIDAGNLIVLWIANKYPSNGPAEPSGWTTVGLATGGSGSAGVDSGSVYSTLFVKEANGTEGGTVQAVSIPSGNASRGMAWVITKSASMAWEWAYATGTSPTPGNWSTTFNVNPGVTAGDLLWVFSAVNGDAATSWSAESLSIPGATLGTMTERHDATTTQGDDLGMFSSSHPVSSGTATGVGTYTATRAGSTTANSPAGASLLVRFREVTPPTSNIDPSGIASGQALGTATIEHAIDATGIASAEALGTVTIEVAVDVAGIASAEAFGVPALDRAIDTPSIDSTEAFGAAAVVGPVDASFQFGAFQLDAFQFGVILDAVGVDSGEALGSPTIAVTVDAEGIASGAAFGVATIDISFPSTGVASAEAFGTPTIATSLSAEGIGTAEAFGTPSLARALAATGIASGTSFGVPTMELAFDVVGVASAEAFGAPYVSEPTPFFEDYEATVELVDYAATVELDTVEGQVSYTIKTGDLAPGIAGRITVPEGVDLTGATLSMTFTGRTTGARTVSVVLDGQDPDNELVWLWHYNWQEGDTADADEYRLELSGNVDGLPMTFPNSGWATFAIEERLA